MAEHYRFFDSIDGEDERLYTADEFAEYFRQVLSSGILNGGTNLQVVCSGTDMNVSILPGYAWLEGYLYKIDTEPLVFKLDTAHPSLDRIDRVVIRLDKRLEHRYVKAFILKGIPAQSPEAPAITRDENIYEISLAQIKIIAGKSFTEQSEITDERFITEVCGLANSLITVDTTDLFLQMQIQWDKWFSQQQSQGFVLRHELDEKPFRLKELDAEAAVYTVFEEYYPATDKLYLKVQLTNKNEDDKYTREITTFYADDGETVLRVEKFDLHYDEDGRLYKRTAVSE